MAVARHHDDCYYDVLCVDLSDVVLDFETRFRAQQHTRRYVSYCTSVLSIDHLSTKYRPSVDQNVDNYRPTIDGRYL